MFAYLDQTKSFLVISLRKPGELKINSVSGPLDALGFENGQTNRGAVDSMGSYKVAFADTVGNVIAVPASAADVQLVSSSPADKATLIPLGDINGDGRGDYIASVRDVVASQQDLDSTPTTVHPHQAAGPSLVRIHLGGINEQPQPDGTKSVTLNANTLTLQLPAPLLTDSFGTRSSITTGDLNGDGLSDIVVMVHTDPLLAQGRPLFSGEGIYVVYGRSNWGVDPVIDVATAADVIFTGIGRPTSIVSPGNVVGATPGFDDLLIGQIAPFATTGTIGPDHHRQPVDRGRSQDVGSVDSIRCSVLRGL